MHVLKEQEEIFWQDYKDGENKAFSEIYNLHVTVLFAYGMKLCQNREIVQDAIHDIFIDIYVNRNRRSKPDNLRFYLIKSLKNRILRNLKKERKYSEEGDGVQGIFYTEYSAETSIIEGELDQDKIRLMTEALKDLSQRQQEILYLRFTLGFNYMEIAKMVNLNHDSVRKQVYRTLKKIRSGKVYKNYKDLFMLLVFTKG
jgi:RNA polymerase sigma factor (sigma-70 family)